MRTILDPLKRDLEEGRKARDQVKEATDQVQAKEKEIAELKKKMKTEKEETRR